MNGFMAIARRRGLFWHCCVQGFDGSSLACSWGLTRFSAIRKACGEAWGD